MARQASKLPKAERLPSGAFRCRVMIDGKSHSFTAETAQEAQRAAMLAKLSDSMPEKEKPSDSLGSLIDRYINSREPVLSPSTVRNYRKIRRCRMQSLMDLLPMDITQEQWQRAISSEARENQSAKSIRNTWGLVGAALREAGLPVPVVRLPQVVAHPHEFFDDAQVKVFLEAIRGKPVELAALLALNSLRESELMALRWQDIDLEHETITVAGAWVADSDNLFSRKEETKNKTSHRTVSIILPRLTELLRETPHTSERLVTVYPQTIYRRIEKVCAEANLPFPGVHGLRHTFASICYYLGIPEKAIMEMGGWSDPTVLRRIYTHISTRQKDTYTDKIRGFFGG